MQDFDPRDFTSHTHDDRRPELSRGGHTDAPARGPERATGDPREIAVRHVNLPSFRSGIAAGRGGGRGQGGGRGPGLAEEMLR